MGTKRRDIVEPLTKYEIEYDLEGSGFYKLHEFYLASDMDALLRQRDEAEKRATSYQKLYSEQYVQLGFVRADLREVTQQLAASQARCAELEAEVQAKQPDEPRMSSCGHYDCNEADCYGQ